MTIPWELVEKGAFAFLWNVPVDGFQWRSDLAPAGPHAVKGSRRDELADENAPPFLVGPAPVGVEAEIRRYGPLAYPTHATNPLEEHLLHRRFSRLNTNELSIIKFANIFGDLGGATRYLANPDLSESPVYSGTSLAVWKREITDMAQLLDLWNLVNNGDAGRLGQHFVWDADPMRVRAVWHKHGEIVSDELLAQQGSNVARYQEGLFDKWVFGDPIEPARFYVTTQINARLKAHVSPVVIPFRNGLIRMFPDSLLSAMYLMFAMELGGRVRQPRPCPECDRYFVPSHGRQKYCDSACKNKAYRRRRAIAFGETGSGGKHA